MMFSGGGGKFIISSLFSFCCPVCCLLRNRAKRLVVRSFSGFLVVFRSLALSLSLSLSLSYFNPLPSPPLQSLILLLPTTKDVAERRKRPHELRKETTLPRTMKSRSCCCWALLCNTVVKPDPAGLRKRGERDVIWWRKHA